ncbi:hypothetical protein JANAI62_12220 [Jannaschia pagri]|uniref:Phage regulatory protein CII (CP76) n=1 Tax=Jannaschia pagri TaxID=2829797 RepID=A0ABQ4NJK2_9RHOB|nr:MULTISPECIES: hypothetical protein [unclassified Jannaschia]GIT90767.1 hypothetical protein JANAI61_12250 [Jannaschia sp. AI_61]GIT94599.1 hypothetical protein JANAI62_12220 [Jannaschia sp. AI_62]
MTRNINSYLKQHTEALVKDVGVQAACTVTGKSKATLGRYYSDHDEHRERFMPVDAVARLEGAAKYPHVTHALAELAGLTLDAGPGRVTEGGPGAVSHDIALISERFAMLMNAYASAISNNVITPAEARGLLSETMELQKVLVDMKMHLQIEVRRTE